MTPEAERMAEIVSASASHLRLQGFKKRRNCFNRTTASGLVHVVNFWQHPKEPPAWTEVPGLRERRYGTFRLDFGVYIPEMTRSGAAKVGWINEFNCDLRATIGQLVQAPSDWWWPLTDPTAESVATSALVDHGLPWLERFPDHQAVLQGFRSLGPLGIGLSPAGALDIACMLAGLGRDAEERAALEAYVRRPMLASHVAYLESYLPLIGHADLVVHLRQVE